MKRLRHFFCFALFFILLLQCTNDAPTESPEISEGLWRAEVTIPGGNLPFGIELKREKDQLTATLLNGNERATTDDITIENDSIQIRMPAFNSFIRAQFTANELNGTLTLNKRGGKIQVMPLQATLGPDHRFFETPAANPVDIAGRWAVTFVEDDGKVTEAVGEFQQDGSRALGTFLTPTGDYRYLAGDVQDSTLYLSCFDGGHAFLFIAKLQADGGLKGDFWSGTAWHESWTAQRDETVELPNAFDLTYLKDGYDKFDFTFPNIDSVDVSISDDQYRDRVVLVTIVGSWCPNCHDEARYLSRYYKENRERGLEIIALMFEHIDDFPVAVKQIKRFRKKFGIEYETLFAGYSDKKAAAEKLPMLNHVLSYPTTIFIDRQGRVRKIHTGFTGPGTGAHYDKLIAEFEETVETLLAE